MFKRTLRTFAAVTIAVAATVTATGTAVARDTPSGDLCYRAHVQNFGWQDWRCDGEWAGTTGKAAHVEAVEFDVPLGATARFCVKAHRSNHNWDSTYQCTSSSRSRVMIGTTGMNTPIEAIAFYRDSIIARIDAEAHIRNDGWKDSTYLGGNFGAEMIGTTGRALPIEAFWFKWA
ncbi:hypothetical protein ACWENA_25340 [Streptomyces sp. NPDC004779]